MVGGWGEKKSEIEGGERGGSMEVELFYLHGGKRYWWG